MGNNGNGATSKRHVDRRGRCRFRRAEGPGRQLRAGHRAKGTTRLAKFNENIVALYASGMSTRDIKKTIKRFYDVDVSPDLISGVTEELRDWQHRPLDAVYPILYIDALIIKVRTSGTVVNRPAYVAVGVDVDGRKQVLGTWMGDGGEGAKFCLAVLTELRTRGVTDVLIVCCDGLKGLPDAIEATWPNARCRRRGASYLRSDDLSQVLGTSSNGNLRPIYTAVNATAARAALDELVGKWGWPLPGGYPAVGVRVGGVHPVLGLRRREPPGAVFDQRHREPQRPLPPGRAGPRTLSQ